MATCPFECQSGRSFHRHQGGECQYQQEEAFAQDAAPGL